MSILQTAALLFIYTESRFREAFLFLELLPLTFVNCLSTKIQGADTVISVTKKDLLFFVHGNGFRTFVVSFD